MDTPLAPLHDFVVVEVPAKITLLVVPRGPDWVSRQTYAELRSLNGWKISGRELESLLSQWRLVKRLLLGVMLLATMLIVLSFDHYSTLEWRMFAVVLLISGIVGTIANIMVSAKLKRAFSESFLENEDSDTASNKSHQPIRISVQNIVSWISRQTNEEVLSVEGWTQEDLTDLVPLLSRKRIVQICRHVFGVLFIVVLWIPFYWQNPNYYSDENGEPQEQESRMPYVLLFATQMSVIIMYGIFVCWSLQLSRRVEMLFSNRFRKRRSRDSTKPDPEV